MGAIDHHGVPQPCGRKARAEIADVIGAVIRPGPRAAAENHVAGVVAGRVRNRGHALLGHGRKPVRRPGRQHRVDRGLGRPVGGVLEPDGHRQPRRELTMHLALRGTRADRHPRGQVGDVLRDLRIEKLGGRRQPHIVDVEEQLAGEPQPLVDVEVSSRSGSLMSPFHPTDVRGFSK